MPLSHYPDLTTATTLNGMSQSPTPLTTSSCIISVAVASVVSIIITALLATVIFVLVNVAVYVYKSRPDWFTKLDTKLKKKHKDQREEKGEDIELHAIGDYSERSENYDDYYGYSYDRAESTIAPSEYNQRNEGEGYYPRFSYARNESTAQSEQVYDQIYSNENYHNDDRSDHNRKDEYHYPKETEQMKDRKKKKKKRKKVQI